MFNTGCQHNYRTNDCKVLSCPQKVDHHAFHNDNLSFNQIQLFLITPLSFELSHPLPEFFEITPQPLEPFLILFQLFDDCSFSRKQSAQKYFRIPTDHPDDFLPPLLNINGPLEIFPFTGYEKCTCTSLFYGMSISIEGCLNCSFLNIYQNCPIFSHGNIELGAANSSGNRYRINGEFFFLDQKFPDKNTNIPEEKSYTRIGVFTHDRSINGDFGIFGQKNRA